MAIVVTPTNPYSTHDIRLTKDSTDIGLILCDPRGRPTPLGMQEQPSARTAMRVAQGAGGYGDFELPYTPLVQGDFSGGMGGREFESDTTRYYDGNAVDTSRGMLMPAGKATTMTGATSATPGGSYVFELGGMPHCVLSDDLGGFYMYRNGLTGLVRTTPAVWPTTTITTSLDLSGYNLAGKIIKIVSGPGAGGTAWRVIASNTTTGTNDSIVVTESWEVIYSTSTRFVVVGLDAWISCAVGTFSPTCKITDAAVIDGKLYLCQGVNADVGTAANVASITMTVAAGGPTYTGADEGAQRDLVRAFVDTDGVKKVITTVNNTRMVYRNLTTALISAGTAAPMNGGLACGTSGARITGIQIYDEPPRPYVFFEDEIGSISNNVYSPIRLTEMPAVRSETNGRAACTSDKYLFFSMGEGIERYYSGILDDVGPDRGEGLPTDRRGNVVSMVAYPGGIIYAAVDGGYGRYSSILKYNGSGWTEIYRGALSARIRGLYIDSIPGMQYQRLMFHCSSDMMWIPIAKNPLQASGFTFSASCTLTTAWMQTAYKDIRKFWNSLKLFTVNASATRYVTVEYQTDDEASWHQIVDSTPATVVWDASPSEENLLTPTCTVAGIKLRFRLTLTTPSPYTTPVYVERMVTEAVTRIPPKRSWVVNVLLASFGRDANGDLQALTAQAQHATLRGLSNSGTRTDPVLMRTRNPNADSLYVFVEPSSVRPIRIESDPAKPDVVNLVCSFSLVEA